MNRSLTQRSRCISQIRLGDKVEAENLLGAGYFTVIGIRSQAWGYAYDGVLIGLSYRKDAGCYDIGILLSPDWVVNRMIVPGCKFLRWVSASDITAIRKAGYSPL